jgi:hypothetical protein
MTHAERSGGTGSTRFAVGSGYAALQEPIRECEVCEGSKPTESLPTATCASVCRRQCGPGSATTFEYRFTPLFVRLQWSMKEASTIIARILGSSAQKSRPQGRGLLVRVDVVLHPSVGNQPDRRNQDVRRDAKPHPEQRADYAEQVNQRADPALEVAAERLP